MTKPTGSGYASMLMFGLVRLQSIRPLMLALAALGFSAATSTEAVTYTWDGNGGNVNWSTPGNWAGDISPVTAATTDIILAGTNNTGTSGNPLDQDIGNPLTINTLTFSSGAGAFFVGGFQLRFEGSSNTITQDSSSAQRIANAFNPTATTSTITITLAGSGTGVVTLSGLIPDGPSSRDYAILKTGDSTFSLTSPNNTYGGGTTLNGGTLSIGSSANIGGASSAITFNGGTLQITGTTLTGFDTHVVNYSSFNGGLDIAAAGNTFVLGQSLGGVGSLTKLGAGTLNLTTTNTYSGGTLINAGTLQALADGALGGGDVSIAGGTATLTLSGGATNNYISDNADLNIVSGSTVNLNFTGEDVVSGLIVDGVSQGAGTYGSTDFTEFTGTGFITVIPEPSTYVMIFVGGALLVGVLQFRRKNF